MERRKYTQSFSELYMLNFTKSVSRSLKIFAKIKNNNKKSADLSIDRFIWRSKRKFSLLSKFLSLKLSSVQFEIVSSQRVKIYFVHLRIDKKTCPLNLWPLINLVSPWLPWPCSLHQLPEIYAPKFVNPYIHGTQ